MPYEKKIVDQIRDMILIKNIHILNNIILNIYIVNLFIVIGTEILALSFLAIIGRDNYLFIITSNKISMTLLKKYEKISPADHCKRALCNVVNWIFQNIFILNAGVCSVGINVD